MSKKNLAITAAILTVGLLFGLYIYRAGFCPSGTCSASLIQLITFPSRYEGRNVDVVGYLSRGMSLRLYVTRELAEASDSMSSISVSDDTDGVLYESSCVNSYVRVLGTFRKVDTESYALKDVQKLYQPGTNSICWAR